MSDDLGQILTEDVLIQIKVNADKQTISIEGNRPYSYLQMLTVLEAAHAAVVQDLLFSKKGEKTLDNDMKPVIH